MTTRQDGIIPARAGFTISWTRTAIRHRDHPRSRGVYALLAHRRRLNKGSSPLARGLLISSSLFVPAVRIIPARAGFTQDPLPSPDHRRDHPRSRGVYSPAPRGRSSRLGSSPLARGLHVPEVGDSGEDRIIPARAGFTPTWGVRGRGPRDHPRSRGVYMGPVKSPFAMMGSSPLARGLLPGLAWIQFDSGIIPARAGFTKCRECNRSRYGDHPRSRGVYLLLMPC